MTTMINMDEFTFPQHAGELTGLTAAQALAVVWELRHAIKRLAPSAGEAAETERLVKAAIVRNR